MERTSHNSCRIDNDNLNNELLLNQKSTDSLMLLINSLYDSIYSFSLYFDNNFNNLVKACNDSLYSQSYRGNTISLTNSKNITKLVSNQLSMMIDDTLSSNISLKSGDTEIEIVIKIDGLYNSDDLTINSKGKRIKEILIKSYINLDLKKLFNINSRNVIKYQNLDKIESFDIVGYQYIEILNETGFSSGKYLHLDESNLYFLDSNYNYNSQDIVIKLRVRSNELKVNKIEMFSINSEIINPISEELETVSKQIIEALERNHNYKVSLKFLPVPDGSSKYLILKSFYDFLGLGNKSNDEIIKAINKLKSDNKIVKEFKSTIPEIIKCHRSYALIVIDNNNCVYKTNNFRVNCFYSDDILLINPHQ